MDAPGRECNTCLTTLTKEHYSNRQWSIRKHLPSSCKTCVTSKVDAISKEPKRQRIVDESQRSLKRARRTIADRHLESSKGISVEVESRVAGGAGSSPRTARPQEIGQQKRRFDFQWPTCPVSGNDEKKMAAILLRQGEFGRLDADRRLEVESAAETIHMSLDQALSLRSTLLQRKAMNGHFRLESKGGQMLIQYKDGTSITDLSKRFDFPPMNIFRQILAKMKWSKARIKKCLREPKHFKKRERREFEAAEAADIVSKVNQSESLERADMFEDILADWFEDRGVRLRRQSEMVQQQKKDHGRALRTPDILFLDHVEINGSPVAWMDAKNFYGADVGFQQKNAEKQMSKYIEEWGSGAVVYRYGFSEKLRISRCTLLDASSLDLSKLEPLGPAE